MSQPRSMLGAMLSTTVPMYPANVAHATQATQVAFFVDPQFVPVGERRWSLSGAGELDEHGRFSTPQDLPEGRADVACEVWHNGVCWGQGSAAVGFAERAEDEGWQILNQFLIDTPAFSSLETPTMFANGRQQLNLMMELDPSGDALEIHPDELSTLRVFELLSRQQVAMLDGSDPVLLDSSREWAIAWVPNDYEQAAPLHGARVDDAVPRTAQQVIHCYLHTTAGNTVNRRFFAGLRDRFGTWHYSNGGTKSNEFGVNPRKFAIQVQVQSDKKSGFDISPTPGQDQNPYHYNHDTVEYWIFTLPAFRLKTFQFLGQKTSMARWERDATNSRFASYTGYVVPGQSKVQFDTTALTAVNFNQSTHLNKEAYLIDDDQVALCNFRVSDVRFTKDLEQLQGPITLDLVDVFGNGVRLTVQYGPKGEENHRDVLQYSSQIL